MEQLVPFEPTSTHAIILAEGPSKEKLYKSPGFTKDKDIFLINRAGIRWPHYARFWATYHAEWVTRWWTDRQLNEFPMPESVIVSKNKMNKLGDIPNFNITKQVQGLNMGGTSAIMAALVALGMGYDMIHLFGVDLTPPYEKDRKFWSILKNKPLIFHGEDWFHRNRFYEF